MQTQSQPKYGNNVLETYRPVLLDYLKTQKPRLVESSDAGHLEQKVVTMILNDFSTNSPLRYIMLPLRVHNMAQVNAMVDERGEAPDEAWVEDWVKKNSDKFRLEENSLIASLFEKDSDYFLDVLRKAA